MTKLMEEAIDRLRHVQPELQDEIARAVMMLTGDIAPDQHLTDEDRADLDAADDEFERGEIATEEEVRAVWSKHGL